uniref:Small ribosomal subunit protein uS3m n=1 Tax=Myochromella boudieri TaxID=117066 RepID=A0A386TY47_9AGAR|nr:ribosomal protein S3 [Myochromella boudieri]AYE93130.1 ribosomal protein S3 [Myochromella boudieri]
MTNLKNVKDTNSNNIVITTNEISDIKIDNRIIPLFSSPVYFKTKILKEKSKYNFNTLNSSEESKNFNKVLSYKEIVSIFLKGFKLYNINLKDYLLNHKKLDLIEYLFFIRNNNDKNYNFNIKLNKFLFLINKYTLTLNYKSFLFNRLLFIPTRLFKPQSHLIYIYQLREIEKILLYKFNNNKKLLFKLLNSDSAEILNKYRGPTKNGKDIETDNIKHLNYFVNPLAKKDTNTAKNIGSRLIIKVLRRKLKIKKRIILKILDKGKVLINDLNVLINEKENLINNYSQIREIPTFELNTIESVQRYTTILPKPLKCETLPNNLKSRSLRSDSIAPYDTSNIITSTHAVNSKVKINELKVLIDNSNNKHNFEKTVANIYRVREKNKNFLNNKDSFIDPIMGSKPPVSVFYYNNTENKGVNAAYAIKPIIHQYLKEMSIYNIRKKGIFIFYSILTGFFFNSESNKLYKNIYNLLAASFKSMYCLISKPVFISTPDKIVIQLFYFLFIPNILKLKKFYKYASDYNLKDYKGDTIYNYNTENSENKEGTQENMYSEAQLHSGALSPKGEKRKKIVNRNKIKRQYSKFRKIKINVRVKLRKLSNIALTKVFSNKLKILCLILNKIFKKPVELDLIRTHYPYNDSNILVNLLGIMINKIKLRIIIRRFFEKAIIKNVNTLYSNKLKFIPAFLSGVTIRVAGRLLTHKVVPRRTVKITRRGASASGRINFKDVATYTNKNKRGAFSITVKSGQNFF